MSSWNPPIWFDWAALITGMLAILIYELRYRYASKRHPFNFARSTHARIRAAWARALMNRPGNEVLAVQTIRNSVMSATITGSTAAIALMGTLSFAANNLDLSAAGYQSAVLLLHPSPRELLLLLLIAILFTAFVLSVMAVRFYNHVGYMVSTLAEERRAMLIEAAGLYIMRAGNYYSMSMRAFLWMAPIAIGLLSPLFMPVAAVTLIIVLDWFDRLPAEALLQRP